MILICSSGHVCNISHLRTKCPVCRRKLLDVQTRIEAIVKDYYGKWLSGDSELFDYAQVKVPRGTQLRDFVSDLLLNGKRLKAEYTISQIRGCHDQHLFLV